jgi:hypothetical protein
MRFRNIAANYVALFLLLFLTANALVANWTLDPIWDLLYARVQSSFFHNTHAISTLSICAVCFVLLAKFKFKGLPMIVVSCVATASIHELTLAVFDIALSTELPQGVSLQYAIYLSAFLILAVWKGSHFQRRILGTQFFVLVLVYLLDVILKPGSTISGSEPSPFFYNPLTNAVEVLSWVVPALLWLLPRTTIERWAILSQR